MTDDLYATTEGTRALTDDERRELKERYDDFVAGLMDDYCYADDGDPVYVADIILGVFISSTISLDHLSNALTGTTMLSDQIIAEELQARAVGTATVDIGSDVSVLNMEDMDEDDLREAVGHLNELLDDE